MIYAALDETGLVINTIVWDGEAEYAPGEGLTLLPDGVGIGWTLVNGEWVAPPPRPLAEGEDPAA